MSYEAMADQAEARELGAASPQRAWVCTDRDVWHPNPFYDGPEQPHPEDDDAYDYIAEFGIDAWRARREAQRNSAVAAETSDELPF